MSISVPNNNNPVRKVETIPPSKPSAHKKPAPTNTRASGSNTVLTTPVIKWICDVNCVFLQL